jgi:hypothetical protein
LGGRAPASTERSAGAATERERFKRRTVGLGDAGAGMTAGRPRRAAAAVLVAATGGGPSCRRLRCAL